MIASHFDTNFWVQFVAGVVVAGGGVFGIARWVTHRIAEVASDKTGVSQLIARLDAIEKQYQRNGGSSMRDAVESAVSAVNRIEMHVTSLQYDIQRLDKAIERHIGYHEGAEL